MKIQKRTFPSRGRARLNTSMLSELDAKEGSDLEIVNEALHKSVTVTLFADSMVEEGYIRLGAEDLESLNLDEEDTVIIRKKPPLPEQMKKTATETAEHISEHLGEAGETIKEGAHKVKTETIEAAGAAKGEFVKAYGRIKEEVTPVTEKVEDAAREAYAKAAEKVTPFAERISGVTKETMARVKEEVTPYTEKVEGKAKEAYAKVKEELPSREDLSQAAGVVMSRLKPGEETKLKKMLEASKGSIQIATISSQKVADNAMKDINLPPDVVIAAVQRNKEVIIPSKETRLVKGDIVYLIGKDDRLREAVALLEG